MHDKRNPINCNNFPITECINDAYCPITQAWRGNSPINAQIRPTDNWPISLPRRLIIRARHAILPKTWHDVTWRALRIPAWEPPYQSDSMTLSLINHTRRGQSIKIDIGKPIDNSIKIDKSNLIFIDCIDQSIKIDTHSVVSLNCYRFYRFYLFYRRQGWLLFNVTEHCVLLYSM